jgi:hypothetical protein
LNTGSATLVGVLGTDIVSLISTSTTGSFADKNVGSSKAVSTSGFTLGGTDSGNYTLTQPSLTANITTAGLTISGVTANNKVYNGTTSITLNTRSTILVGIFGGDVVSLISTSVTGTFADKNAGTAKGVSVSGFTLGGTDAGNYNLTQPSSTANITTAGLTISGVTANNKVYNATTTATLNTGSATLVGVLGTDIVSLISTSATGSFADKNVGSSKAVSTSGFTLGGTDSGNYTLTQPTLTANITTAALTVSGVTANNKVYNATTTTTLNTGSATLVGVLGTDIVSLISTSATGTFANKNAGTGKGVSTSGFTLGGTDSGNYTLTQPSLTANITTAGLTISGVTANNKVYNATMTATLNTGSATLVGVFGWDVVSLVSTGATGSFADKNVGSSKEVSTSGFTLGGTDASNYTLTQPSLTANITAAGLTVSGVTANNKVYNATTTAALNTGSATLAGVFGGDVVSLISTGATGSFADKNVGSSKAVSTSGFTLGGTDAGNYTLTQPSTTANITAKTLTVGGTFTPSSKVYDGTTAATIATNDLTLLTKDGSDVVTLTAMAVFANNAVGTGKTVSLTGSSLAGADAPNYTLSLAGAPKATANITAKQIIISPDAGQSKTEGDPDPEFTYTFAPLLFVPDIISGALGRYAGGNPGFYAYKLGNLSAGSNYSLVMVASPSTFTISPSMLTLKNYPNPFFVSTKISYTLPFDGHVSLTILNLNGQIIKTIVSEMETKGDYILSIDDWDLQPAGMYLATLRLKSKGKELYEIIRLVKGE